MIFALQEAKFWEYITSNQTKLRELIEKEDDNKNWLEKIDQQKLDYFKFDEKKRWIISKIEKIYTYDVQQEFLAMKNVSKNKSWTPKKL